MDSKDSAVLSKLLQEASIISGFVAGLDCDAFIKDEKTRRAVCMTLINIGELVKLLSDQVRTS